MGQVKIICYIYNLSFIRTEIYFLLKPILYIELQVIIINYRFIKFLSFFYKFVLINKFKVYLLFHTGWYNSGDFGYYDEIIR